MLRPNDPSWSSRSSPKPANELRLWPGRPSPLGATWKSNGVNFALFSENATNVELCVKSDADLASALDQAQTVAVTAKIVQHNLTVQNKAYDLKNTVWLNLSPFLPR